MYVHLIYIHINMETLTKTIWAIDPTHSEVTFKVKHLVISTVTGTFNSFEGALECDQEDFDQADASFSLDVNSIDTNVADRDAHLKSSDFFAADQYPTIQFNNGKLKKNGEKFELSGDLTIRDITKKVSLTADYGGTMVDPYGQTKAGFEINGVINRKDFGLNWSAVTEAGGIVVGDDVKLNLNIQVIKK